DWIERENWDAYQAAYDDALTKCSTAVAPWFVVPADKKWFRDLVVAEAVRDRLEPLKRGWLKTLEDRGRIERGAVEEVRPATRSNRSGS
ncbi:MAG: polyphosphate kinase 2 family protein, partial [Chloroflexota bacterium]